MAVTHDERELVITAFHEAGHAVVGNVMGLKIQRISIERNGRETGHTRAQLLRMQRSAVFALAGHAAEEVLLNLPVDWPALDLEGSDLREALEALSEKNGRDVTSADAEFIESWERARAAVRAASRRIRAVAGLLFEVRAIEGEERVRRAIEGRGRAWYTRTVLAIHGREPTATPPKQRY